MYSSTVFSQVKDGKKISIHERPHTSHFYRSVESSFTSTQPFRLGSLKENLQNNKNIADYLANAINLRPGPSNQQNALHQLNCTLEPKRQFTAREQDAVETERQPGTFDVGNGTDDDSDRVHIKGAMSLATGQSKKFADEPTQLSSKDFDIQTRYKRAAVSKKLMLKGRRTGDLSSGMT